MDCLLKLCIVKDLEIKHHLLQTFRDVVTQGDVLIRVKPCLTKPVSLKYNNFSDKYVLCGEL